MTPTIHKKIFSPPCFLADREFFAGKELSEPDFLALLFCLYYHGKNTT